METQRNFNIDSDSGVLTVVTALDREEMDSGVVSVSIKAAQTDDGSKTADAMVFVTVEDENDNAPEFELPIYSVSLLENSPVSVVLFRALVTDPDQGGFEGTLQVLPESTPFSISPDGTVRVNDSAALDRETTEIFTFQIKARETDPPNNVATANVSVTLLDENDNSPMFSRKKYEGKVFANQTVGMSLVQVQAEDPDADVNGQIKYSIDFGDDDGYFSVNESTGNILLAKTIPLVENRILEFPLYITARDGRSKQVFSVLPAKTNQSLKSRITSSLTLKISLLRHTEACVWCEKPYSRYRGNCGGVIVMKQRHVDGGSCSQNTGNHLSLDRRKVKDLSLMMSFSTSPLGGVVSRFSSALVNIRAPGNSKPQFLEKDYRGTIEEEQDPGVVIVRVSFSVHRRVQVVHIKPVTVYIPLSLWFQVRFLSADAVTLSVKTEPDKFSISPEGELTTKVKLDYDEAPHNYSVEIVITDELNSDITVVKVHVTDINDNSPVFASSSVTRSVPEDAEPGSNVTAVPATDKDSGFNQDIRYSLRGGGGSFSIDPVSGMVRVDAALDRETQAQYDLQVVAEDQGRPARSATATLLVQVSDVNDNVPRFPKAEDEVKVLETKPVGTVLLTLSAVDPDDGANGRVSYSLVQQSPSSDPAVFELDSSSGTLRLVQPLDYSQVKVYRLEVQASDGGTPSLVGNSSVVVWVQDVNNNPPEFSKERYDVAVPENLASAASILTLEVTDRDEGGFSNGYFLYNNDTFDINKQGVVSLRKDAALDRETKDSYILQVVAVDQVTDGLRATAQLNITVLDYNDNAPQFPSIAEPLLIPEGDYSEEAPGEISTIVPTDADLGLNGEVTLSLASSLPLFRFREDGTLLAVGALDRESRDTYELLVKASDKGSPQRENFTTVTVRLLDVNDNRPEFSSSSYVSSILLRDAEEGRLLLTLSATDRDAGDNSLISYSFSSGSSPYLALNNETGAVTLTSDLADVTEDTTLELTAMAKDHGRPPLNSTARVVVCLRVASLVEGVGFLSPAYNFSLPENQPAGAVVG
uniref:cadherin-23 n=1 Tax=Monopterus albus TaxID=43700 RepID=UPI0009B38DC5